MNDIQVAIKRAQQGGLSNAAMDQLISVMWRGDNRCPPTMAGRWRRGENYPQERNRDALLLTLQQIRNRPSA